MYMFVLCIYSSYISVRLKHMFVLCIGSSYVFVRHMYLFVICICSSNLTARSDSVKHPLIWRIQYVSRGSLVFTIDMSRVSSDYHKFIYNSIPLTQSTSYVLFICMFILVILMFMCHYITQNILKVLKPCTL